jgi:hypothetical protein
VEQLQALLVATDQLVAVRTELVVVRDIDVRRLRVQVERLRVHDRYVDALEETFRDRLPARVNARLLVRRQIAHRVAAEIAEVVVQPADVRGHIDGVITLQHHPHEPVPFLARQLHEPERPEVERVVAVTQRHAHEHTLGVVDPSVMGHVNRRALPQPWAGSAPRCRQ